MKLPVTTWTPHPRHPNATPPADTPPAGSVPATESASECIARCCRDLMALYALPTLAGARTSDLLAEITMAAAELDATVTRLADMLLEAEGMHGDD